MPGRDAILDHILIQSSIVQEAVRAIVNASGNRSTTAAIDQAEAKAHDAISKASTAARVIAREEIR